jgi:branched-chain amino acid transport system permease protein
VGWRNWIGIGALVLAVWAAPRVLAALDAHYMLVQLNLTGLTVLVCLGLVLLMGYAGQLSLGHAGFFALGAYTSAILTAHANLTGWQEAWPVRLGLVWQVLREGQDFMGEPFVRFAPWAAVPVAMALAAGAALLLGLATLRLRGHYMAMATLGFGFIIYNLAVNFVSLTRGPAGIHSIPEMSYLGIDEGRWHVAIWAVVIVTMILMLNTTHSRVGRALRSIHGGEEAARAMGVDTVRLKLIVFVLSAMLAAFAGSLFAHKFSYVGPEVAGVSESIWLVTFVAVGGMANLWGGLVAALVLRMLFLSGYFGEYTEFVFGVILVVVMMSMRDGVPGAVRQGWLFLQRRLGGRSDRRGEAESWSTAGVGADAAG